MKNIFKTIVLLVFAFINIGELSQEIIANQIDYSALNLIQPSGQKQVVLGEFDELGRATSAHIQLQNKDEPTKKREPRIKFNPKGWHNYKMAYGSQGKKSYLFNRSHLIGYQFSGLTNEGRNLAQLTAWTNSGNYKGMDDSNTEGMLYYENRLDSWLANHPNYWLDYRVTPIYSGDELVPRQIKLQYVGIDEGGNLIQINFSGNKEITDAYGITTVTLENYSANATIDYLTGRATPSLVPTESSTEVVTTVVSSVSEGINNQVVGQAAVVYIARNGNADVYWYSKDNMPTNTNFSKVVEMSEADALALGKRHTSKE